MIRARAGGWPAVDTSPATWRGRALRYLLIYLVLLVALVAVRYVTRDVRVTLLAANREEATLSAQRDELALEVESLSNVQRVRDWAFANGMQRFAEATKTARVVTAGAARPVPDVRPAPRTVEVETQWK